MHAKWKHSHSAMKTYYIYTMYLITVVFQLCNDIALPSSTLKCPANEWLIQWCGNNPNRRANIWNSKKLYCRVEILMDDFAAHYLGNFVLLTVVQTIRYGLWCNGEMFLHYTNIATWAYWIIYLAKCFSRIFFWLQYTYLAMGVFIWPYWHSSPKGHSAVSLYQIQPVGGRRPLDDDTTVYCSGTVSYM